MFNPGDIVLNRLNQKEARVIEKPGGGVGARYHNGIETFTDMTEFDLVKAASQRRPYVTSPAFEAIGPQDRKSIHERDEIALWCEETSATVHGKVGSVEHVDQYTTVGMLLFPHDGPATMITFNLGEGCPWVVTARVPAPPQLPTAWSSKIVANVTSDDGVSIDGLTLIRSAPEPDVWTDSVGRTWKPEHMATFTTVYNGDEDAWDNR